MGEAPDYPAAQIWPLAMTGTGGVRISWGM